MIDRFTGLPLEVKSITPDDVEKLLSNKHFLDKLKEKLYLLGGFGATSSGGGGDTLWETTLSGALTFLTPVTNTNGLLIGEPLDPSITTSFGTVSSVFNGSPSSPTAGEGLNYFMNLAYGSAFIPLGGLFLAGHANGTAAAPAQTVTNDWLGGITFTGFGTTAWASSAANHVLPGMYSQVVADATDGVLEEKIYIGGLLSPMISFNTLDNAIKLNESQLVANITAYYSGGAAMAISGSTGNITAGSLSATTANSLANIDTAQTFTNKRITKRTTTTNAPGATPSTNTDTTDVQEFTGLNTAITSMTTNLSGTPVNNDMLEIKFLDDGTPRAITWGASFASSGTVSLPTTTVTSTTLRVVLQYSTTASLNKWVCVAVI